MRQKLNTKQNGCSRLLLKSNVNWKHLRLALINTHNFYFTKHRDIHEHSHCQCHCKTSNGKWTNKSVDLIIHLHKQSCCCADLPTHLSWMFVTLFAGWFALGVVVVLFLLFFCCRTEAFGLKTRLQGQHTLAAARAGSSGRISWICHRRRIPGTSTYQRHTFPCSLRCFWVFTLSWKTIVHDIVTSINLTILRFAFHQYLDGLAIAFVFRESVMHF